jgi:hypothetical protein
LKKHNRQLGVAILEIRTVLFKARFSIRAPIGNIWIPEPAHRTLIKPPLVTKLGTIIKPMDEDMLVNKKKKINGMP